MNKIVNYCQLAFRANKVSYGSLLIPSIQNKQAKLVIFPQSCGANRKKKLKDKCTFYNIPYYEMETLFFNEISNKAVQSIAITDEGFAKAIIDQMKG